MACSINKKSVQNYQSLESFTNSSTETCAINSKDPINKLIHSLLTQDVPTKVNNVTPIDFGPIYVINCQSSRDLKKILLQNKTKYIVLTFKHGQTLLQKDKFSQCLFETQLIRSSHNAVNSFTDWIWHVIDVKMSESSFPDYFK